MSPAERRALWLRFFASALAGTADPRIEPGEHFDAEYSARWVAEQAAMVANAAMARVDCLDLAGGVS